MMGMEAQDNRDIVPSKASPVAEGRSLDIAVDAGMPVSPSSRVLVVEFRSGEAVQQHPELVPLIEDGWNVRSAVPRLVDGEGIRLLVVLDRRERLLS